MNEKAFQLEIYGQTLTGGETGLELARLSRKNYLKGKTRRLLEWENLGDTLDCLTDLVKTVVLVAAIQTGEVTDTDISARLKASITAQLALYGGAEAIMAAIEAGNQRLQDLMGRYYEAKTALAVATDIETINQVDIEPASLVPGALK